MMITKLSTTFVAATVAALAFIGSNVAAGSHEPAPAPCRSIDVTGCTPPPPPGYELPDPTGGFSVE